MYIKIKDLNDDTLFYVNNGHWYGYVTTEDGKKVMYTGVNKLNPTQEYVNRLVVDDFSILDIEIIRGSEGYHFDVAEVTNNLINWIKDWFDKNGKDCNAVLGISGGKDSTIAAALCVKALGKERVIGVMLPNGKQSDIVDSIRVCDFLGIKSYTINIKSAINENYRQLENCGVTITEQCKQNIVPRERTKMIRAICQCENGRMVNTCNLSEDYIGYFTIGGDGDGDFSPLGNLTKTEVIEIGHFLGLPSDLVDKAPSDGLCGKTDEDNFGFTYEVLDKYIRTGVCDEDIRLLIDNKYKSNLFKLKDMDKFTYSGYSYHKLLCF